MSTKTKHATSKTLLKVIDYNQIYLYKSWDLTHGIGYFVRIYALDYSLGFGFSKNKFTAVKEAIKSLKK
jgi:hypothetical protein